MLLHTDSRDLKSTILVLVSFTIFTTTARRAFIRVSLEGMLLLSLQGQGLYQLAGTRTEQTGQADGGGLSGTREELSISA